MAVVRFFFGKPYFNVLKMFAKNHEKIQLLSNITGLRIERI